MKKKVFLLLSALWTAFIFFNSLQIGEDSAAMSGFFVDIAIHMLDSVGLGDIDMESLTYFVRKAAHFTEFFVQGVFLSLFVVNVRPKYRTVMIYVLFFGLFTACCDELLQMFVDGRGSAVRDVFFDFAGTVCAAVVFGVIRFFRKNYFTKLK